MTNKEKTKEPWIVLSFIDFIASKGDFDLTRTTVLEGRHNKTKFKDPATQILFEAFIAGKSASNSGIGHFVIGKFVGSSKIRFGDKPYIHGNKKSALTEVERLLQLEPKQTFIMYQSVGIHKYHGENPSIEQSN